jgi:hypothetical protein
MINTPIPYKKIILISDLDAKMIDRMLEILLIYYGNTTREQFERDLFSKTGAICIFEPTTDKLIGFSTFKEFYHTVDGQQYVILFSGDTIIEKEYWGSQALAMGFGEQMVSMINRYPDNEIYWFLISKGIRTYKYLPAFFKEYYPNHKTSTPEKYQRIMDSLAYHIFPDLYDKPAGVINVKKGQFLKSEFFPPPHPSNEIEEFYFRMNPGHIKGDELVCLTALKADNVCDHMRRALNI